MKRRIPEAQISLLHLWSKEYPVTRCARCGAHFSYTGMDARGPFHCQPTPSWLLAHPSDTATR